MKRLLVGLVALVICLGRVCAQTATLTPATTTYAAGGGTISFSVSLSYPANTTSVGFEVRGVPAGWTFREVGGANVPQVTPAGDVTDNFEFAYTTLPPNTANFTFTVAYPAGLSGAQRFSGINAIVRPPLREIAVPDVVFSPTGATAVAPSITTQPTGATVVAGATVQLSVAASGTAPLTYQWTKDGAAISGATNATLTLTSVTTASAGSYRVTVTNAAGSVTSNAAIVAITAAPVAPSIVEGPAAQVVAAGGTASFSVTASGTGPLAYQWRKDGAAIAGATSATLTLSNVQASAAGAYSVVVTNGVGSVTSAAATLTVNTSQPATPTSGVWFGPLGSNAGTFALLLRADRTGVFLGYGRSGRIGFVARDVTLDANRNIRGTIVASGDPAPRGVTLEAAIGSGGALSGSLAGATLALASPGPAASGATQGMAGFYQAGAIGAAAMAYAIADAAGGVFALTIERGTCDAGTGTLSAAGAVELTTDNGARHFGSVNAGAGTIVLSVTVGTSTPQIFSGANDDARSDVEKLINISTRSQTGAAAGALTAGFVIAGGQAKQVLVRGIGPTLASFGITGALAAARLEVVRTSGGSTVIGSGGDWASGTDATAIANAAARLGAFALPNASRDAALLLTLEPGAYTATVTGQGGATGIALLEIYDATTGAIPREQRLINLSTRAVAAAGENALVAGFVIRGDVPKRVLVRGAGPALAAFGVPGALAAPRLAVNSSAAVLAQNDGWSRSPDVAAIAAAGAQVGAFAFETGSLDAALLLHLSPGVYTAQVTSAGAPGVALLEVYEVP